MADDTNDPLISLPVTPSGSTLLTVGYDKPTQLASNIDVNALHDEFSGKDVQSKSNIDVDSLHKEFSGDAPAEVQEPSPPDNSISGPAANRQSFVRGVRVVLDSLAHGLGYGVQSAADAILPDSISKPIDQSVSNMIANDTAQRNEYEQNNTNASGTDYNKLFGEMAATAPLVPIKAIQLWKGVTGALPTVASTSAKIAAPFVNRLAGAVGEGGIGGASYGAATSSDNDQSTLGNIGQGLITGAIAGPALHAVGEAAGNTVPAISNLWAKVNVGKLAKNAGIDPVVAQNVISRLSDAGYSPQDAQAALTKLGPKATLMDLDNSLTTEGSGLASMGGKPTAILKNRMEARAATANNDTVNIIDKHLGPKLDIDAEKENVIKAAQKAVKPDYEDAYKSGDKLDISGAAKDINKQLETAVGGKRNALLQTKGFLFKDDQTTQGSPVKILKTSIPELHEIRMALDDIMEGREPDTSAGKNTLRSLGNVRQAIDDELKSNAKFAAADEKFADKMEVAKGFKVGHDALTKKTSTSDFAKTFNNAMPETKETIRKGMRAAIGDYLEQAQKGELSGATRLFGNKSANRENLKLAFGSNADQALDALQKEASFRATENAIRSGSQTAERSAVQSRYNAKGNESGNGDLMRGVMADVLGGHGVASSIAVVKRGGAKVLSNIGSSRLERLVEGTSDILSQQGTNINKTLNTLDKVATVQNKIIPKQQNKYKLPVTAPAVIGENLYQKRKQIGY